jgi:hypothetical protein
MKAGQRRKLPIFAAVIFHFCGGRSMPAARGQEKSEGPDWDRALPGSTGRVSSGDRPLRISLRNSHGLLPRRQDIWAILTSK